MYLQSINSIKHLYSYLVDACSTCRTISNWHHVTDRLEVKVSTSLLVSAEFAKFVALICAYSVSPLMSPILAGVFGAVIQDSKLTMKGVRHEAQVEGIVMLVFRRSSIPINLNPFQTLLYAFLISPNSLSRLQYVH
jgi:hypothetical protein